MVWGLRREDFSTVHFFDSSGDSLCNRRGKGGHWRLLHTRPNWNPKRKETCPECRDLLKTYTPIDPP